MNFMCHDPSDFQFPRAWRVGTCLTSRSGAYQAKIDGGVAGRFADFLFFDGSGGRAYSQSMDATMMPRSRGSESSGGRDLSSVKVITSLALPRLKRLVKV
jgi:hypothetical protein